MLRNPIDRYGLAIAAAITAAGYFGGIRPLLAQQTHRVLTEREVDAAHRQLEQYNEKLDAAEGRVKNLTAEVAGYRARFEASSELNERIGEVAELADVLGIAVDSITPGQETVTEGYRSRPISITGSGSPDAIARLLSQIRDVFPDMGARSFSVGARGGEVSSLTLDLDWLSGRAASADSDGTPDG